MSKESGTRRRQLKKLWRRLHDLQGQRLSRDALLLKLGGAKAEAGRACRLVDIRLSKVGAAVTENLDPDTSLMPFPSGTL